MTIGEYIYKKIDQLNLGYPKDLADEMMVMLNIDEGGAIDQRSVDLFFYNVIPDVLMRPMSVSEGQYSISYDKDAIIAYYRMLANRLGLDDMLAFENTIKDITARW